MGDFNPLELIGSGLQAGASIINTAMVNNANRQMTRETNAANREMVKMQNEAAAAEAEKAYNRSKAGNQVSLMRAAGMSQAGAINALNGGGSYTPAPVNVSQDRSSTDQTTDFSALGNISQIMHQQSQLKEQKRQFDKSQQLSREQHKESLESNERIAKLQSDTSTSNTQINADVARERLKLDKEKYDNIKGLEKRHLEAVIVNLEKDAKLKDYQKERLAYEFQEYASKENRSMRDAESLARKVAAMYNYDVSYKDFLDYRDRHYMPMYDNNEIVAYIPRRRVDSDNAALHTFDRIWEMLSAILPIEVLGKIVSKIK